MKTPQYQRYFAITACALLVCSVGFAGAATTQQLAVIDVVIGNNFSYLPMFVGVEKGFFKKHGVDVHLKVSYDPRVSRPVMQAFEAAEDDVLKNTLKGAARLSIPDQFASSYLADVETTNPEYFSDLPALPR